MSEIQATTSQSASASITHDTLDSAVVAVVNMLSGKKYTSADSINLKMSEDVLYAGLVYDTLLQQSPSVAKTFKEELKMRFDRRTTRNDSQPLAKAIQDILDNAVKSNKLSSKQSATIVKDAFGHAQLDKRKTALSRTARPGAFETIEKTLQKNVDASDKTYTKFEDSIAKASFITPSAARHQRKEFDKIVRSFDGKTSVEPTKTETPKTETGKPIESGSAIPSILDAPQNPNQFIYDPKSSKDGHALVMIPLRYAHEVSGVHFLDKDGKTVSTLEHTGSGKDGRRYFRADRSGEEMKETHIIRLLFTDGTDIDLTIGSGDTPFIKQYLEPGL